MIRKLFICYCILSFLCLGTAQAMFIPDQEVYNREDDLKKIQTFLELKLVQHKLSRLGLSKQEIEARVKQLDDEQIHQIAMQIRSLKLGGRENNPFETFEAIVYAAIFIAMVIVAIFIILIAVSEHYQSGEPETEEEIGDVDEQD